MVSALAVFAIIIGVIFGALLLFVVWSALHFPEQCPPGDVSHRKAKRIQIGMTKEEVVAILGNPQSKRVAKGRQEEWEYQIVDGASADAANLFVLVSITSMEKQQEF